jgi:ribose transport system permease protein
MAKKSKPTEGAAEGTAAAAQPSAEAPASKLNWQPILMKYNSLFLLAILIAISSFMSPYFFSFTNLVNVLRQQTNYILIAMGLIVCMAAGGVDLALAATVGIGSIMTTEFMLVHQWPVVASIFGVLAVGSVIGAVNGFLIAYVGMAPFVVTLCMSFNLLGFAHLITRGMARQLAGAGANVAGPMRAFLTFGQENDPFLGLPMRFEFALVIVLITWFIMTRTKFGRLMLATGSNPIASRLAGIDIRRYKLAGHVIASFTCTLTGVVITAATASSAVTTLQGDYTMIAMAAAIIGGSTLEGGGGNVPFTVVGIFVMGLINNIMNLANIAAYPQFIVKAAIIVLAIYLRTSIDKRT